MEITSWDIALIVSKAIFYGSLAILIGYIFYGEKLRSHLNSSSTNFFTNYRRLVGVLIILGLFSQLVWFLSNVGAMSEDGISGMLDRDMIDIVWGTAIGSVTQVRVAGLILMLICLGIMQLAWISNFRTILYLLYALSCGLLLYSFSVVGHVSELQLSAKLLLSLHVGIMAWWFGMLIPLKVLCQASDYNSLHKVMHDFGKQASIMVPILLVFGLIIATMLVDSFESLITTSYGQLLISKIFTVALLLSLAAIHKYKFVPRLKVNHGRRQLSKSISVEIVIAVSVLFVTAALTTLTGPHN